MKLKIHEFVKPFLAAFLRDEEFFIRIKDDILLFTFDSIQAGLDFIIERAINFYNTYKKMPNKEFLLLEVETGDFKEEQVFLLIKIIEEIYSLSLTDENYKVDKFVEYFYKLLFQTEFEELLNEIKDSKNFDIQSTIRKCYKFLNKISHYKQKDLFWDLVGEFVKREEERGLKKDNKRLFLGIKDLDDQLEIIPGTITAFLAPFKRYKSITLTHVGWAALMQGFNVFHINYEGRREMWEARYDARLTDVDYKKIISKEIRTPEDQQRIETIYNILSKLKQRLFLAYGDPYKTNVDDIERMIEKIENDIGARIDVVIIDYFQIMGSSMMKVLKGEDDWLMQGNIAWDLVRLARNPEYERIIVGALQTKMTGLSASSIKSQHSGRSIIFPQAIDNLIAINQTEDEFREGVIRFSPLFIREGEIKKEHCKVEAELWKIKIAKEADKLWNKIL